MITLSFPANWEMNLPYPWPDPYSEFQTVAGELYFTASLYSPEGYARQLLWGLTIEFVGTYPDIRTVTIDSTEFTITVDYEITDVDAAKFIISIEADTEGWVIANGSDEGHRCYLLIEGSDSDADWATQTYACTATNTNNDETKVLFPDIVLNPLLGTVWPAGPENSLVYRAKFYPQFLNYESEEGGGGGAAQAHVYGMRVPR